MRHTKSIFLVSEISYKHRTQKYLELFRVLITPHHCEFFWKWTFYNLYSCYGILFFRPICRFLRRGSVKHSVTWRELPPGYAFRIVVCTAQNIFANVRGLTKKKKKKKNRRPSETNKYTEVRNKIWNCIELATACTTWSFMDFRGF